MVSFCLEHRTPIGTMDNSMAGETTTSSSTVPQTMSTYDGEANLQQICLFFGLKIYVSMVAIFLTNTE